jgi:hypothetical protein
LASEVLGVADFGGVVYDAVGLEEAVVDDPTVRLIFVVRVHQVSKVARCEPAAWGGKRCAVSERLP